LNIRTTFEVRSLLEVASAASGRSLAQEAELRLERSFLDQRLMLEALELGYGKGLAGMLLTIGEAMRASGQAAGFISTHTLEGAQNWIGNPIAFLQATEAAVQVLNEAKPLVDKPMPLAEADAEIISSFGRGFANAILEEAASGVSRSDATADRAKLLHTFISAELAERFKEGEPREPLIVQASGPSPQSPLTLAKLSKPAPRAGAKK